ncbi:hypothetical protein B9T26_10935 [Acinetobacter sp. ANC 4169]|nr:hypothetical protein B9T26_10935 [Acinetobacter sp. ANC 4169]
MRTSEYILNPQGWITKNRVEKTQHDFFMSLNNRNLNKWKGEMDVARISDDTGKYHQKYKGLLLLLARQK